jgi:transcription elongation factor GreA
MAIYKKALNQKCVVVAPEGNYEVLIEKIYK